MSDPSEILRKNLAEAMDRAGIKARPLAEKAGLGQTAVRDFLTGRSKFPRYETIVALAEALGTTADFLLGQKEKGRSLEAKRTELAQPTVSTATLNRAELPRDVPVMGTAMGANGDGAFVLNQGDPVDFARRGPGIAQNRKVFAVYVEGDSMVPRYEPGELIYLDPARPVRIGDDVLLEVAHPVQGEPPRTYLKRLVRRTADRVVVEQFNPAKQLEFPVGATTRIVRVLRLSEIMGL